MQKFLIASAIACAILPKIVCGEVVQKAVVNMYCNPQIDTEVESQATYGMIVKVLQTQNDMIKIQTPDGDEGWVELNDLIVNTDYENSSHLRPVKNLFAHVYRVKDTTPFPPLMTIPYGCKVKLDQTEDLGTRWVSIQLVSGEKAWIQRGDIEFSPKLKSLEEVLLFSKKFLGLPYTWGGTSSFGFDCSGFIQMLFSEMGLQLPRNAKDMVLSDMFTTISEKDLQPGDLVFFGQTRVTHVGMYLGGDEFIHSGVTESPIIMISNLKSGKYNFFTAKRIDFNKIDKH